MLLKKLAQNRSFRVALAFVLIQQLLVAAGTYLLAHLAIEAQSGGATLSTALALLACVALPGTAVHYGVSRFTVLAIKEALSGYYAAYVAANKGRSVQWRCGKKRHDVVCRTGPDTVQSATLFVIDAAATSLNILLNIASVMLVTGWAMGLAISVAGLAGLWIVHLSGKRIALASRAEMLAEGELTAHVQRSWDNVVLGNQPFLDRWLARFETKFSATRAGALRSTFARDGAVAAAGLVTNLIVMGTALSLVYTGRSHPALVLGLVVTLPRSLQIVMHMQVVQGYWAAWKSLTEKLSIVEEGLQEPGEVSLEAYITPELIRVSQNGVATSFGEISLSGAGRITISGANGAGKSTALLALKAREGAGAVYLPAHHVLELAEEGGSLSSGEAALSALRCAAASTSPVLLLDEWDANLSPENRAWQHAFIEELARSRVVVEVRHS